MGVCRESSSRPAVRLPPLLFLKGGVAPGGVHIPRPVGYLGVIDIRETDRPCGVCIMLDMRETDQLGGVMFSWMLLAACVVMRLLAAKAARDMRETDQTGGGWLWRMLAKGWVGEGAWAMMLLCK